LTPHIGDWGFKLFFFVMQGKIEGTTLCFRYNGLEGSWWRLFLFNVETSYGVRPSAMDLLKGTLNMLNHCKGVFKMIEK